MNKLTVIAVLVVSTLNLSTPAMAKGGRHNNAVIYDYAKVVHVEPLITHVRVSNPVESCWNEEVPVYHEGRGRGGSATPMILGGIIGGVIGSTMGQGKGKDAATVAGALLGTTIGHDIGRRGRHSGYTTYTTEQVCKTEYEYHDEERITGYRVTYRYKGEEFVTHMDSDPGKRLRVRIHVEPAI